MGYTLAEMRKAAEMIAEKLTISYDDAARIVGTFQGGPECGRVLSGCFTDAEIAKRALEIKSNKPKKTRSDAGGTHKKRTKKNSASNETHEKGNNYAPGKIPDQKKIYPGIMEEPERVADHVEAVAGDIVPGAYAGDVPPEIVARVENAIRDYCARYAVEDLRKARQTQWKAACMYTGQAVFKRCDFIHDRERERTHGGTVYDVKRVDALAGLWAFLCVSFDKAPFIDDFATFAALSDVWIYGTAVKGELSPERVNLLQKLQGMQERGLAGLIADGRQNPTGALAILNHWHGWTQTREIIHTDSRQAAGAALPVFNPPTLPG